MQHTARMRVLHGVANIHNSLDQRAHLQASLSSRQLVLSRIELVDRFFQADAMDKLHRVKRLAIRTFAQTIDGHDTGMLQASSHFGFNQKRARLSGLR